MRRIPKEADSFKKRLFVIASQNEMQSSNNFPGLGEFGLQHDTLTASAVLCKHFLKLAGGTFNAELSLFSCLCQSTSRLVENASDTFSHHLEGLSAFTPYAFRVLVSHTHGQTASSWATLQTAEDCKYTCQCAQVLTCTRCTWDGQETLKQILNFKANISDSVCCFPQTVACSYLGFILS